MWVYITTYKKEEILELSNSDINQLSKLGTPNGLMKQYAEDIFSDKLNGTKKFVGSMNIAIARNYRNKILGWAYLDSYEYPINIGTYVNSKYRRRNIGTFLIESLLKIKRDKKGINPWTETSQSYKFYKKLKLCKS